MLTVLLATLAVAEAASHRQKPNIIYILADDAGIGDIGCYGGKKIKTPNVDKLCREGMKFTQHYSGSTVCAPSRSCLMTGQHTGHTRIRGNSKGAALKPADITVAEMLKKAGYTTGCVGKWGLGDQGSEGVPWKQGVDFFYGFLNQGRAHHYYPDYLWHNDKKVAFPDNPKKRTEYCHDHFTTQGLQFIRKNKDNPFFLYMAYTVPHVDLDVPEDSMTPYYAAFKSEKRYKGGHYRGHPTPRACFAGMISRLDRDVGTVVDLLKELGIEKNTLVIFTSDNGATTAGGADPNFFDSNGIYRGVKRDLYEGGIITPHIAWWPGMVKAGSSTDHISAFWDLMPTAAEMAGVACPTSSDGISFLPTLLGKGEQKKHTHLYWEFYERGGKQAVRRGSWKAVRLNVGKNRDAPVELYDLSKDPSEKRNLADTFPDIAKEMAALMASSRTESERFKFFGGRKKKKK